MGAGRFAAWDDVRTLWALDPDVAFLNHGSFGACPMPVLEVQAGLRAELEREPAEFLLRQLPRRLDDLRARVGPFLGADPADLVFVRNASAGVATVLSSLDLRPGDEIVVTDHEYPAVQNGVARACERAGARAVTVSIPLPLPQPDEIVDRIRARLGARTRLVIIDHVTSQTATVMPAAAAVEACRAHGVPVLVDGAHAPGMLPLDLRALGSDFFTGNFHKWVCAPKGAAFLHVAPQHHPWIRPLVTSHGAGAGFHDEFDWAGTDDPTGLLAVPTALDVFDRLGWEAVREHNRALVHEGRALVADSIGAAQLVPASAASMAVVPLPPGIATTPDGALSLRARFYDEHRIEVAVIAWEGRGLLRLSAQVYNRREDYERLASALPPVLG